MTPPNTSFPEGTRRPFSDNRRIALNLLRQRIDRDDAAAERAAHTARWRLHDQLVRGNPTRVERPTESQQNPTRQRPGTPAARRGRSR